MKRDQTSTQMSRREMLRTVGTGAAAMTLPAASAMGAESTAEDLKEKARKNIKLGIFTRVYAGLPLEQAARKVKEDGFGVIVLDFDYQDIRFDPLAPDWEAAKKITACFEREGIRTVGLFGYYNVIDPDTARRKLGEQRIDLLMKEWKRFGSPIISIETGTFNPKSEFAESPENYTEEGYVAVRSAFERLVKAAERTGAVIAIEPYWRNIIHSAERAERLFRDIASPSLKLTMDPCNYLRNEDLLNMKQVVEDVFRRVGSQTVIAHAKDVKAAEGGPALPASGLGVLDYPLYLRLLAGLDREVPLLVEHLTIEDVGRARDFVKSRFERI